MTVSCSSGVVSSLVSAPPFLDVGELPQLCGSKRQVGWAKRVRREMAAFFPLVVMSVAGTDGEMRRILEYFCDALLRTQTDAGFWLEARDLLDLRGGGGALPARAAAGRWFLRAYLGASHPERFVV